MMKFRIATRQDSVVRLQNFTIVELLVVIAIIVIISAMLLPALSAARQRARAANCVANERQIWLALEAYRSDFGDFFPPASSKLTATGSVIYWSGILGSFRYLPYPSGMRSSLVSSLLKQKIKNVFQCPEIAYTWTATRNQWTDYGLNGHYFGIRALHSNKPSSTPLLMDVAQDATTPTVAFWGTPGYKGDNAGYYYRVDWKRHGMTTNCVYLDGHSAAVTFNDWDGMQITLP
jgi:type II secretory pathway pseudopilin PulG